MSKIGWVVAVCVGVHLITKSQRTRNNPVAAEAAFENEVRRITSGMYRVKTPADMGFCQ